MDMSPAALPARTGRFDKRDEAHPLFPVYRQYRNSMIRLMVDGSDFRDWLYQHERQIRDDDIAKNPRFPEFQQWMRDVQAGRRPCCPTKDNPRGLCFPHNFQYWLDGGRW